MGKKKSNFRKGFRKNKRIRHPTYVVGEIDEKYEYLGITHSESYEGIRNVPLERNPDPEDGERAYLRPIVEKDHPKNFGRSLKGWNFSKSDKKKVDEIVKEYKQKKK